MLVQGTGLKIKDGMTNLITYTLDLYFQASRIQYPEEIRNLKSQGGGQK
jgi:hypothetical protein